jgi:hypothetical protein
LAEGASGFHLAENASAKIAQTGRLLDNLEASSLANATSNLSLHAKIERLIHSPPDNISSASSSANAAHLRSLLIAEEVAQGHAFEKHVVERGEFSSLGIRTREQFQSHVEGIVNHPEIPKRYAVDGTTYYLDESTRTNVIQGQRGEATAFRSDYGVGQYRDSHRLG